MSAAKPWLKFYPRDWRADEKLRLCSLAARGLWVEMIALMHSSEKYGYLLVSGKQPTNEQLASLVGAGVAQVMELVSELAQADVFSRNAAGTIYSRRMILDERKAKTARKNGQRGGNPRLRKDDKNPASVKGGVKLRGQRTETHSNECAANPAADILKDLYDLGLAVLSSAGHSERQARSLVGRWRKDHGDGPVLSALTDARLRSISNPVEWITKRLKANSSGAVSYLDHVISQRTKAVA